MDASSATASAVSTTTSGISSATSTAGDISISAKFASSSMRLRVAAKLSPFSIEIMDSLNRQYPSLFEATLLTYLTCTISFPPCLTTFSAKLFCFLAITKILLFKYHMKIAGEYKEELSFIIE